MEFDTKSLAAWHELRNQLDVSMPNGHEVANAIESLIASMLQFKATPTNTDGE